MVLLPPLFDGMGVSQQVALLVTDAMWGCCLCCSSPKPSLLHQAEQLMAAPLQAMVIDLLGLLSQPGCFVSSQAVGDLVFEDRPRAAQLYMPPGATGMAGDLLLHFTLAINELQCACADVAVMPVGAGPGPQHSSCNLLADADEARH
jgi:hypothetical protein